MLLKTNHKGKEFISVGKYSLVPLDASFEKFKERNVLKYL